MKRHAKKHNETTTEYTSKSQNFIEMTPEEEASMAQALRDSFHWENSDEELAELAALYDCYVCAVDPDEVKNYARIIKEKIEPLDLKWDDFMGMMASQM